MVECPVVSLGKGMAKWICHAASEPWCLLRQPSELQRLPSTSHTGFPFLVVLLPREMELQYFDL